MCSQDRRNRATKNLNVCSVVEKIYAVCFLTRRDLQQKKYCDESSTVYNMRACVSVFVHVVGGPYIQTPDPIFTHFSFLHLLLVAVLSHWSVSLPSSQHTPPQVAIMSGMILMSWLLALLLTDKWGGGGTRQCQVQEKQYLPSPSSRFHSHSHFLSHRLSQQVDGSKVSLCDITALCLPPGGSGFSTTD